MSVGNTRAIAKAPFTHRNELGEHSLRVRCTHQEARFSDALPPTPAQPRFIHRGTAAMDWASVLALEVLVQDLVHPGPLLRPVRPKALGRGRSRCGTTQPPILAKQSLPPPPGPPDRPTARASDRPIARPTACPTACPTARPCLKQPAKKLRLWHKLCAPRRGATPCPRRRRAQAREDEEKKGRLSS